MPRHTEKAHETLGLTGETQIVALADFHGRFDNHHQPWWVWALTGQARMDRVIAARAETMGVSFDEMRDEFLRKISLRRMVEARDVANLALFLASDLARNISGQVISVDGNTESA